MSSMNPVSRYKLDDISHFLNALAHFPYINGITSMLSALYDLLDIAIHLLKSNVVLRKVILKAALSRFIGNSLLCVAKLAPIITFVAFMTACPWLIPLISLIPVTANFIKQTKLSKEWKTIVHQNTLLFNDNPTEETLKNLREARDTLYSSTQERFICLGLVIGALLSVAGLLFPPLLIPGIVLSITSAAVGFIDKRYHYSKRISRYIFGDFETAEENLVKKNNLIKTLSQPHHSLPSHHKTQEVKSTPTKFKAMNPNPKSLALNQSTFFQNKPTITTQKQLAQAKPLTHQRKI